MKAVHGGHHGFTAYLTLQSIGHGDLEACETCCVMPRRRHVVILADQYRAGWCT